MAGKVIQVIDSDATVQHMNPASQLSDEDFRHHLTIHALSPQNLKFDLTVNSEIINQMATVHTLYIKSKFGIEVTANEILTNKTLYLAFEEQVVQWIAGVLDGVSNVDCYSYLSPALIEQEFRKEIEEHRNRKIEERIKRQIEKQNQTKAQVKERELALLRRFTLKYGVPTQEELEQFSKNDQDQE